MEIGDSVKTKTVEEQTTHRWIVLSPLETDDSGNVVGGKIYAINEKNSAAEKIASAVRENGERALVLSGRTPGVSVGAVFVK